MKVRIKLVAFLRKDWDTVVRVPDDATNAELTALAAYYDDKIGVDDYVDDTDYCDDKDPEFLLVEDEAVETEATFVRGTAVMFPPKATLATVEDEQAASKEVATALRAHGLPTLVVDDAVVFELGKRKYRLELAPEE